MLCMHGAHTKLIWPRATTAPCMWDVSTVLGERHMHICTKCLSVFMKNVTVMLTHREGQSHAGLLLVP